MARASWKSFAGAGGLLAAVLLLTEPVGAQSLQQGNIQPLGSAAVTPQQNGPAAPVTTGSATPGTGTAAPASPKASNQAPQRFNSEADARTACGSQPVVWVNTRTKRFIPGGARGYGRSGPGTFMCRDTASAAGFRASRS